MRLKTLALVAAGAVTLLAQPSNRKFTSTLSGFNQIPTIVTAGRGTIELELNSAGTELAYTLKFSGLEGNATAARIHIGNPGTNGLIVTVLCGANGRPACPATAGEVKGVIKAADIGDAAIQGIAAGEFVDFVKALRAGALYVAVNSAKFTTGELRGQINWNQGRGPNRDDDDDDHDDDDKGKDKN